MFPVFLFPNDTVSFSLEPYGNTIYYFDSKFPKYQKDISIYSLKINSSMSFPLNNFNFDKSRLFIEDTTNTIVKLNFIQDHSNRFYDTQLFIKNKLKNNKTLTTILESKSIGSINLKKNIFFNLKKSVDSQSIDFSYLFHDESIKTYIDGASFSRTQEFYSLGFKYSYNYVDYNIANQINFQFSNYKIVKNIKLDDFVFWNSFDYEYLFNKRFSFFIVSDYKSNEIDYFNNESEIVDSLDIFEKSENKGSYYFKNSFLGKYSNDMHSISFGVTNIVSQYEQYKSKNLKPFFNYDLKFKSNFTINISSDIVPFNRIENIFTHISRFYEQSSFSINFENQNQKHILSYAMVNDDDDHFDIISYSSYIYKDWFKGSLNFNFYDKNIFFINQSISFELGFFPKIKSKSFDIYFKLTGNYLNLNNDYSIDFSTISLIDDSGGDLDFVYSIYNGEIGLIFESFVISFVRENLFSESFYYSNNYLYPNTSNYLIDINWTFNE